MARYANLSGDSGAIAYSAGLDYIDVIFRSGQRYRYSYRSAGQHHVEHMKHLAHTGKGLTTYISQFVKDRYEHRSS